MSSRKFLIILISGLSIFGLSNFVYAQGEGLSIEITKPREGETLYAGPDTWMYSVNIEGKVSGVEDPTTVDVMLEIIQNDTSILSSSTEPDETGLFIFEKFFIASSATGKEGVKLLFHITVVAGGTELKVAEF